MKRRNGVFKRGFAALLALILVLGNLSGVTAPVNAETAVYGGLGTKVADAPTVNNWKNYMGQNPDGTYDTELAGGVWTDKSVFETAEDYFAATDEEENFTVTLANPRNFMLSLSAMASTKTIVGYSTLPTDTIFVLDVSGSMNDSTNRDERMVNAANKAIGNLLALNNYNRVGVVLYSGNTSQGNSGTGTATVLMPLDRYTTTSVTNDGTPAYINISNNSVSASRGVRNSDGDRPDSSKSVAGGTYIQNGIYKGMLELTDPDLDTVITDGFQVGTTRTPIMVLMSDGEPTAATNTYTNIGTSNMGDGTTGNATPDMAFVTQLTAAWAKAKIAQKYGDEVEPLFYTLGLGVGSNSNALSVMDPMNAGASAKANEYWEEFNDLDEGESLALDNHTYWSGGRYYYRQVTKLNDGRNNGNDTLPISQDYVDRYFPASSSNDLSAAFQSIVETIILQTMYYPTLVDGGDVHHSGYLEFSDYIGPNMEIKEVKGVQMGDTLYTGEHLARLVATGMGTVENPTDAGNALVWSVINRLGMGEIGDPVATQKARDLIANAWAAGQLAYREDYDGNITWSNQICWYADEDGNYIKFWDGDGYEDADGAAYAIRSYGFLGEVGEGHRETDMLYASFQVRTALDANGEVIEDIVHGRIPASLIPMVEYHVSLDSNDPTTATQITLETTGATAPIRLLYEVGLRSEIDLLNMEGTAVEDLKTDADGNFIFYTNQWDEAGLEAGNVPSKLHNTYVTFQPSEANERYYYHEDMPVYVKVGESFVRYSGAQPAAGDGRTYYRAYVSYASQTNGGRATYDVTYQQIPAQALANAKAVDGTNTWVIENGTLYLYEARGAVEKETGGNLTETLPYSEYPIVHADAPGGYHLDAILGNNGLLTIDPPEGLKLSKTVDDTITDEGQTYTFTVELTGGDHDTAVIYLITEIDGVRSSWQEIVFTDTYTIELGIDDSAWLAGLPEGNEYTITETIDGEFEVDAITIDGQTVDEAVVTTEDGHIADVVFTNAAVFTGDIAISKIVESAYAPHETTAYAFDFAVTLTGAEARESYETYRVAADGTKTDDRDVTTDENGEASFALSLSHGEKLVIVDLPEGACVEAVETLLPGFTSDQTNDTASADVIVGETANIIFTNTYDPEPVSPYGIVDVYVEKIFDRDGDLGDEDWDVGDSFTFVLEKHVSRDEHEVIEEVTVDYDDADKIADFQSNVNDLFEEVGTYSYRITEKTGTLPGVAYDTAICYFDIVVADDGEGHLYIADVIGRQDVTVIKDDASNTWDVTADFVNTYNSEGAVQVSLSVAKDVTDDANTGINKSGFVFELYDADEDFNIGNAPRATVVTNAEGVAAFHDTLFTEEGTFYFVLKEAEGDNKNMEYDATVYYCTVEITSNPETSGLIAVGTIVDDEGNEVFSDEVEYVPGASGAVAEIPVMAYAAEFTNTYTPDEATAAITGTKTLTGRDLDDGEFIFELYEADRVNGVFATGDYITEVSNIGESFTFENISALTFDETGYYYFAIKEQAGDLGGVSYDKATLYVTIHVTADLEDDALVVNSVNVSDENGVNKSLTFTNEYVPAATEAVIEAAKEMTGRSLTAGMFEFYLYEDAVSGTPIQAVRNEADGSVKFELSYNAIGEYDYVIVERIPANAVGGKYNGVSYDTAEYPVHVSVTDEGKGQLEADVTYPQGAPVFENDYTPEPVQASIGGIKTLSGRTQTANDVFTMTLYQTDLKFANPRKVQDVNVYQDANGNFVFNFDAITYTEAGGYRYIIVEQNTGDSQISYDGSVYYALVNVTDNARGQLMADTILGNAVSDGAITSTVNEIEFYNVFTHYPATLTLSGNKTLLNHEWSHDEQEHEFQFALYPANEEFVIDNGVTPEIVTNDPDNTGNEGKFTFSEMTFEEEGTYYYVVKEQLPAGVTAEAPRDPNTGIIYDVTENHITITVAQDPDDPMSLKATYTVKDKTEISFTNEYSVEDQVFVPISGKKVMEGRTLHAEGFSFILKDKDGNELQTVRNTADGTSYEGTFTFQPLHFDAAGTYTFTVEEASGDIQGVTYDESVYTITIQIDDDKGQLLDPVVTYKKGTQTASEIVFTNSYKGGASEPLILEGTKTLHGGILTDTFSLSLSPRKYPTRCSLQVQG